MNAKKCDKCKKFYEPYDGLHKWGVSIDGTTLYEIPYNSVTLVNRTNREVIDLCPDCMEAFDNWLKTKGDK